MVCALSGCGPSQGDDSGVQPRVEACNPCALADSQNYHYSADLRVDTRQLQAEEDATIDWSGLTVDVHGHEIDPTTFIDRAVIAAFMDMSPDEVARGLADETVQQADLTLFVMCSSDEARCNLSEFSILGSTFDPSRYFQEGLGTWLVVLQSDQETGAQAFLFIEASKASAEHLAEITNTSSSLELEVDLHTPERVPALADEPALVMDWSGLTTDGLGNPLSTYTIDELWVARYDEPVETLEGRIFDLQGDAEQIWRFDVGGLSSLELGSAKAAPPFAGLDGGGTWLLALWCTTCTNPAPRFLAVLSPTEGD